MSDLVGNPEDWFSQNEAHITPLVAANRSFLKYDDAQKTANYSSPTPFCEDRKVPKISDARKLCCNLSKIQTKAQALGYLVKKMPME